MKAKRILFTALATAAVIVLAASCGKKEPAQVGVRTDALDNAAWDASVWISVVDAPVVVEREDDRAADGASWFLSTLKNEKKVTSAKWMTAGLGVYDIYVNGKPVGNEFLKPGFTHFAKTKRSFTYDITDAIKTGVGKENVLSAQVTPGWWADKIVTQGDVKGMTGNKCAFRGVVELTFADGSKKLYGTDLETLGKKFQSIWATIGLSAKEDGTSALSKTVGETTYTDLVAWIEALDSKVRTDFAAADTALNGATITVPITITAKQKIS